MSVLVTGGNGFVGKNLIRELHSYRRVFGEIITVNRRDCKSPFITKSYRCNLGFADNREGEFYYLKRIMRHHEPEYIFHLASKATVKMSEDEVFQILQDNILSTQKVCQWSPKGARVILASSVIVYGDWLFSPPPSGDPKYEESYKTEPTSIYGITKRASEGILKYYTSTGQINGVSARMCATVGRGLTHGVVYDFIKKILNNPVLEALGSRPGSTKPYCHIDDLIQALLLLAMKKEIDGEYNIVPDDTICIEEVAKAVMFGLDVYKNIEWLGEKANWKGDNKFISTDNRKIKALGWVPKYRSKQAIIQAVKDIV